MINFAMSSSNSSARIFPVRNPYSRTPALCSFNETRAHLQRFPSAKNVPVGNKAAGVEKFCIGIFCSDVWISFPDDCDKGGYTHRGVGLVVGIGGAYTYLLQEDQYHHDCLFNTVIIAILGSKADSIDNIFFVDRGIMSRLFEPLAVGSTSLEHRIVMAPLTRYRCDDDHCPTSMTRGQ